MNEKNLKPFNSWTPADHRAASSKGGKASGMARRRTAALRELAQFEMARYRVEQALTDYIKKERRKQRRRKKRTSDPDG